jgi:2-polyprenyl-3-methyl-5-hydroxy-6-metoxy-1,4-benzoquinol methylase
MKKEKFAAEIRHGQWLLENDPIMQWGWGTAAGKLRANRRAKLIAAGAGLKPGMKALEIGCGTGLFTEMLAESGADILAVDISADLLQLARKRNLPSNVQFLLSPFEECGVQGTFDAVIGSSVLHHLEIGRALAKIYVLLKPGGIMSFCEPNLLNPQVWFTLKFRRFFPYMSADETAFIRTELQRQLTETGFARIGITPFDWLHPQIPSHMIHAVKKMERIMEVTPGLKEFSGSLWIVAHKPE